MKRTTNNRIGLMKIVGSLVALLLLAAGCAQQVGEIDRTQPDRIEKKDLNGEWYVRHTTIDTPFTSMFSFVGYQSPMERGTFEIQEDNLYFYRTYEFTQNSNAVGLKSDVDSPYLAWLPGDEKEYTPNPYQARDRKFAEGIVLEATGGAKSVPCDGQTTGDSGMHEFCREQTSNDYAYCGHPAGTLPADRTHEEAVCVSPTRYVYRGAPLAAYPIGSHFDIAYEYNATTGEPTNVLVENDKDRYWYERDYIRVDWSDNQLVNYQYSLTSTLQATFDDMEISSEIVAKIYPGDSGSEEIAFRLFRDEAGNSDYMDFVSRHVLEAANTYYEYWGQNIPICVFYPWYLGGVFDCTSEEMETRTAFLRVDPDDDYLPLEYDDHKMDKFGFFRQERLSYDTHYDVTYSGVIRHTQRFDLWDSHPVKENGAPDYAQMNPVPVVFYLSEDFPRDLVPAANTLAAQWAEPLNEVVAARKGEDQVPPEGMFVLCENNNGAAQQALGAGQPVALFNHGLCKDMDYVKRMGDLRYSYLYVVVPPMSNGLLGYGPSAADPLTGKVVSASAYIYDGNMRLSANKAADVVELMTGFIDYQTMVNGLDLSLDAYPVKLSVSGNPPPAGEEEAREHVRGMVSDSVAQRLAQFGVQKSDFDWARMRMNMMKKDPELDKAMIFDAFRALHRDLSLADNAPLTDQGYERMALRNWASTGGMEKSKRSWMKYAENNMYLVEFADPALIALAKEWGRRFDQGLCQAVEDAMGEGIELEFNMDDFSVIKGQCPEHMEGHVRQQDEAPNLYIGQAMWQEYDPARAAPGDTCIFVDQGDYEPGYYWVNTCSAKKLAQQVSRKLQFTELHDEQNQYWKPSAWWADTKDPKVAKTQEFMRNKGAELRAEMLEFIYQELFLSVAIHEVGHTLGLRHNFEGSTDALNYPKKFWEYKVALSGDGKKYMPVDLWARETKLQEEQGIRSYQYSSIMDYGGKFNDQWHGVGLYDKAAIKFGYGGLLEVFKNAPDLAEYEAYLADPETEGDPTSPPPVRLDPDTLETLFKRVHYTQLPNVFGSPAAMYERENLPMEELVGNPCQTDADCGAGGCKGCTECRKQLGGHYCSPPDIVEVPFRFSGDEYVWATPYCDVRDQGADPYEIARNTVDDYWWYWPIWGHWRGSQMFSSDVYSNKVKRAFQRLRRQFQWWGLNYARFNHDDWWEKRFGIPWEEDLNGGLAGAMAANEAFNLLMNMFAIPPSTGSQYYVNLFGYNKNADRYELDDEFSEGSKKRFVLEEDYGKFAARPMYPGYHFYNDDYFMVSGGAIYDRLYALVTLTDPSTTFINIDPYPDNRKQMLSFFSVFPDRMIGLLGGLTTARVEGFAACVVEDNDGNPLKLRLRDIRNMNDPDFCEDGKYLYPEPVDYAFETTWYRLPILAAFYGMAFMLDDFDRRFLDTTRVFLKGHQDGFEVPEDAETVEFSDPMSGKTYIAYKQGYDNTFDTAWFLVNRAKETFESFSSEQAMFADYSPQGDGKMRKIVQLLELLRGMHRVFDMSPSVLVEDPAPTY